VAGCSCLFRTVPVLQGAVLYENDTGRHHKVTVTVTVPLLKAAPVQTLNTTQVDRL
jgi:hypothetical protein